MMGTREKLRGGDEYDALSKRSRRMITWNHGEVGRIKRRFWKRVRKMARVSLKVCQES